jgi:hypothetical protein
MVAPAAPCGGTGLATLSIEAARTARLITISIARQLP